MANSAHVAAISKGSVKGATRLFFKRSHGQRLLPCVASGWGELCGFVELESFINALSIWRSGCDALEKCLDDRVMNAAVPMAVFIWHFHTSGVDFKQPVCQWVKTARKPPPGTVICNNGSNACRGRLELRATCEGCPEYRHTRGKFGQSCQHS